MINKLIKEQTIKMPKKWCAPQYSKQATTAFFPSRYRIVLMMNNTESRSLQGRNTIGSSWIRSDYPFDSRLADVCLVHHPIIYLYGLRISIYKRGCLALQNCNCLFLFGLGGKVWIYVKRSLQRNSCLRMICWKAISYKSSFQISSQ
jgi:hypothetical protein